MRIRIGDEIIGIPEDARITRDTSEDEPPTTTIHFPNGTIKTYGYEEGSVLWDILCRDVPDILELIQINRRHSEQMREEYGIEIPF